MKCAWWCGLTTKVVATKDAIFVYSTTLDKYGSKETILQGALRVKKFGKKYRVFALSQRQWDKMAEHKTWDRKSGNHDISHTDYPTLKEARMAMDLQVFAYAV